MRWAILPMLRNYHSNFIQLLLNLLNLEYLVRFFGSRALGRIFVTLLNDPFLDTELIYGRLTTVHHDFGTFSRDFLRPLYL